MKDLTPFAELVAVKKMLDKRSARLLPVTEAITLRTIELMESLTLSHGLQMGDALIAATAVEHQLPVLTANVKHFGAVAGLPSRRSCLEATRQALSSLRFSAAQMCANVDGPAPSKHHICKPQNLG